MKYDQDFLDLINSSEEPYLEISETGEILLYNRALNTLVGEISGKLIFDLFDAGERAKLQGVISRVISEKQPGELLIAIHNMSGSLRNTTLTITILEKTTPEGEHCLRCRLYLVDQKNQAKEGLNKAQQILKKQTKELAILNQLSVAISSSLDLNEILNSICREMVSVFDARNTGIALLDESQTTLRVVAFHTEHSEESDASGLEIPLDGNDASLFVIKTGEPIVVPDAQFNPITSSVHHLMQLRGTSCLLIVPLLTRGDIIGTIGIPSDSQTTFSREDVQLAMTIAGQIASVIDNARLHRTVEKARDHAELELEIGRQIQNGFFPESLPQIKGWDLLAYFQSARQVAGDFYDAFPLNNNTRLAVVLADVCDKGLGAALFMVLFRSLLRANIQLCFERDGDSIADQGEKIIEAVRRTNNYVALNHAGASMFATVFIAILHEDKDLVWYINCGHDPPFVLKKDGHSERLMPTNPAIGAFPDLNFSTRSIKMHSGDSLVAFTDGVADARSSTGKSFGEKRLLKILSKNISLTQRLNQLTNKIITHTANAEQYDDITLVAFNRD